ncbi:hypothetical protein BCL93_10751 [Onishia taeanensis]|uniref:Uncharacterized protein n=1 Tax=Onishia taeanensis TaxID=284577 RepID=A0A328XT12_9GAMM|nr:hypothetical protein [Halomonas taeanensis]RAR60247.1 hypothetical protein BCL93_10751 [Halomonas taeanensis]
MWFTPGKLDIAPGKTVKFEIGNAEAQANHREMMLAMASGGGHNMSGQHHGGGHGDGITSVTIAPV